MYIEFLVVLAIIFIFFIWFLWLLFTKLWNKWRYKPENDKGKIGEEHRRGLLRGGGGGRQPSFIRQGADNSVAEAVVDSSGQGEPKERSDISAAEPDSSGEDSNSFREPVTRRSSRRFNPFRKKK